MCFSFINFKFCWKNITLIKSCPNRFEMFLFIFLPIKFFFNLVFDFLIIARVGESLPSEFLLPYVSRKYLNGQQWILLVILDILPELHRKNVNRQKCNFAIPSLRLFFPAQIGLQTIEYQTKLQLLQFSIFYKEWWKNQIPMFKKGVQIAKMREVLRILTI